MKPFFSIIIPLYNKEKLIEATLSSVFNQNFTNFEVIIIDDGSTDNSFSMASNFKDDRIEIFRQKNRGAAVSRNTGINLSNGKFIALIDGDDIWHPNHLDELKLQMELFPKAGLYCNNYEILHNKNTIREACFNFTYANKPLILEDYFKASIINPVAWTSAVGFSKEKFESLNGFNPALEIAEDLDLWNRFALNYKVSFNPKVTMLYKFNVENSLSKEEKNDIRYSFINNYKEEEIKNPSLKLYLDKNRYAVALRCKMNKELKLFKKLKKEINFRNLNFKQILLLNTSRHLIILIKKTQILLIKNNIYLSAHK